MEDVHAVFLLAFLKDEHAFIQSLELTGTDVLIHLKFLFEEVLGRLFELVLVGLVRIHVLLDLGEKRLSLSLIGFTQSL